MFDAGRPFRPLEQLLAVLPPASAAAAGLPPSLQSLMTDAASPIVQYYPEVTFGMLACFGRLLCSPSFGWPETIGTHSFDTRWFIFKSACADAWSWIGRRSLRLM